MTLDEAIQLMKAEIISILGGNRPTMYIFGSVALGDFRLGWSDIDIMIITPHEISDPQANLLVGLRQTMLERYPSNPYFRLFEGGMISIDYFLHGKSTRVVYWGTSGQRITDSWTIDSFATAELLDYSILLCGECILDELMYPTQAQFRADIYRHYLTIREHGTKGWGFLLDIARGLYTLQTGKVIAKTAAGEWALENGLCPVPEALQKAIKVRKFPLEYKNREDYQAYAKHTGDAIQQFADVLEKELE